MTVARSHIRAQSVWVVFLDIACLLASCYLAVMLRFDSDEMMPYVFSHIDGWIIFFGSIVLANYLAGSYRIQYTMSRFNLIVTWLFSISFAMFILSVTSYAWFRMLLGRGVLFLAILFYSLLSIYFRIVAYRRLFGSKLLMQRVVIVGCDSAAEAFKRMIQNPYTLPPHTVTAFIDLNASEPTAAPHEHPRLIEGIPVIPADANDLREIAGSLGADLIVLSRPHDAFPPAIFTALRRIRFSGIEVLPALTAAEIYSGRTPLDLIAERDIMETGFEVGSPILWRSKRITDIMTALTGILVCSPLALAITVIIKLAEPGAPVFYNQERVGRFGRRFRMHKFRTMRVDAEAGSGAVWSAPDDPRITRVGRVLRRFRMDEIPQFWNILRGEMSLVGPRPERPELVEALTRHIPYYDERENVLPGITGWAQIQYPYGNTIEDARRKLEYDLFYIRNLSTSLDLQILLRTLRTVLFGKEKRAAPWGTDTRTA